MNSKKTVTIPKRLITSIPISFFFTIFIIYLLHLFGEWKTIGSNVDWFAPENKGMMTIPTKLEGFWNSCAIGTASHYVKLDEQTLDWQQYETSFNGVKLSSSFSNTFTGHWRIILLFTLVGAFIVYFIRGLKFIVVDTEVHKSIRDNKPEKPANTEQMKLQQRYDKGEIPFEVYQSEWNKLNS